MRHGSIVDTPFTTHPLSAEFSRRGAIATLLALAVAGPAGAAAWPGEAPLGTPQPFSFDRLKSQARELSRRAYRPANMSGRGWRSTR